MYGGKLCISDMRGFLVNIYILLMDKYIPYSLYRSADRSHVYDCVHSRSQHLVAYLGIRLKNTPYIKGLPHFTVRQPFFVSFQRTLHDPVYFLPVTSRIISAIFVLWTMWLVWVSPSRIISVELGMFAAMKSVFSRLTASSEPARTKVLQEIF